MKKGLLSIVMILTAFIVVSCGKSNGYDLEKEQEIVIGLEAAYAPFNWLAETSTSFTEPLQGQSGNFVDGYDVQIAKIIAKELNKKLVIKAIDWLGLLPALATGEIDLILAGMSPTADRMKQIDFTDAYYTSELVMVVHKESTYTDATTLNEFDGARVVAQQGTIYDGYIPQIPNVIHQTALGDYAALAIAVTSKTTDAFVAELPVAEAWVASNPSLQIVRFVSGQGFEVSTEDITVAIGLKKADKDLKERLNEILLGISIEQRNTMMSNAVTRSLS